MESELDKAISAFKYYWREKFDLKEQIDMEKGLNYELQKAQFSESELDFSINIPFYSRYNFKSSQDKELTSFSFEAPLVNQIKELESKLNELQQKYFIINSGEQNQDDNNSFDVLTKKIDMINEEIKSIDMCVNSLLDKIVTFEDEELHELRTRKQHIDLQKKTFQSPYF